MPGKQCISPHHSIPSQLPLLPANKAALIIASSGSIVLAAIMLECLLSTALETQERINSATVPEPTQTYTLPHAGASVQEKQRRLVSFAAHSASTDRMQESTGTPTRSQHTKKNISNLHVCVAVSKQHEHPACPHRQMGSAFHVIAVADRPLLDPWFLHTFWPKGLAWCPTSTTPLPDASLPGQRRVQGLGFRVELSAEASQL